MSYRNISALTAAGTALTNSTSEAVLASAVLPANALQAGAVYRLSSAVVATATNGTDTLTVRVRVGPTTLVGTAVASSGAVDVANGDVVVVELWASVRASGVVVMHGAVSAAGAEGTATMRVAFEQLSLDATLAQRIEITGQWSAASASDSCRADAFVLAECT